MSISSIDDYINMYNGEKKEWLTDLVTFMRNNFPNIPGKISYQMPLYKIGKVHIAFSVAKDHFTFHTIDFEIIEELKKLLPKEKFGRGCIKIKFSHIETKNILYEMCRKII